MNKRIVIGLLLSTCVCLNVHAADTKISALPAGTTLAGTEAIPAVQSGATVKTTPAAISTYSLSHASTVQSPSGSSSPGLPLVVKAGDGSGGSNAGGQLDINSGTGGGSTGIGGIINIAAGGSFASAGGPINITAGTSSLGGGSVTGPDVTITGGPSGTAAGGNVVLNPGTGGTVPGKINIGGRIAASTGAAVSNTPSYTFTTTNNTGTNEPNMLVAGNGSGAAVGLRDTNGDVNQKNVYLRYIGGQLTLRTCNDSYSSCGVLMYANVDSAATWGTLTFVPPTLHFGFSGNPITTVAYGDFSVQSSAGANRLSLLGSGATATINADAIVLKDAANGNTAAVTLNGSALYPSLPGTTPSIGGGALLAGACASDTVTISGATTGMAVTASPVTYPGDGAVWSAQITGADTITVRVCAIVALTPTASIYRVRVIQ